MLYQLSYFRLFLRKPYAQILVGRAGFEPTKASPADLQSAPVGHFGISPSVKLLRRISVEPIEGFEPTTPRLQITCSGQLSYIGGISKELFPKRTAKLGIISESPKLFYRFLRISSIFLSIPSLSIPQTARWRPWGAASMKRSGMPSPWTGTCRPIASATAP